MEEMMDKKKYKQQKRIELTECAVEYARRGWHVFPCKWNKTPYTPHGFYDATTNEEQIISWFMDEYPNSLVGIRTGKDSGFWVIDIDKKNGKDGLKSIIDKFGEDAEFDKEKWLYEKTATGGFHLCFKWDEKRPISVGKNLLTGVDIRGEGGYIVAAPSAVKIGDQWVEYEWKDINKQPTLAPEWAWTVAEMTSNPEHKKIDLQQAIENGIPSGSRDDDLFKIACVLQSKGVRYDTARLFIEMLAERCSPPFSKGEAVKKVDYVYTQYQESRQKKDTVNKLKKPFWKRV
jgi:putative DNA primase/helicase